MNTLSPQQQAKSSTSSTLADQFALAAASARNSTAVHHVICQVWRANREGLLADEDAQRIAETATGRRAALATRTAFTPPPVAPPKRKRHCTSPDREKSRLTARKWAAGRHVPATIAQHFPTTELAALAFVCERLRAQQVCTTYIDRIAAETGGSRTTVKRMQREAVRLGILDVQERRIPGRKNETNVITARALDLIAWLHWVPIGGQQRPTTRNYEKTPSVKVTTPAPKQHAIVLDKPFSELTRQERADLLRRTIGKLCA